MLSIRRAIVLLSLPLAGCGERQFVQECQPFELPNETLSLSTPPFAQVRREVARLRFETTQLLDIRVRFELPGARCAVVRQPETAYLEKHGGDHFRYTLSADLNSEVDVEGEAVVPWAVLSAPTEDAHPSGTFRVPTASSQDFTVVVAAHLAPPVQGELMRRAAESEPDLLILNGGFVGTTSEPDRFSALMTDLVPVTTQALVHAVAGAVDRQDPEAYAERFAWTFEGQGRAGGSEHYQSLDLAGIRWIFLDGEDPRLDSSTGVQRGWLDRELADVTSAAHLKEAVVVLHRGPFGLTSDVPNVDLRDTLLPVLAENGVRLMIQSTGKVFEHYVSQGVVVLNEGGGGAALGDPDHRVDRDPDAVQARLLASASYRFLRFEVRRTGEIRWSRVLEDGSELTFGVLDAL
jgi:hypothetical protein